LSDIEETLENEMVSTGSTSRWSAILATVIAFLLGGLVSFIVIRSITKPINRIIEGLNDGADQVASASGRYLLPASSWPKDHRNRRPPSRRHHLL
jgi:methyl-accepting chemotaxis protein